MIDYTITPSMQDALYNQTAVAETVLYYALKPENYYSHHDGGKPLWTRCQWLRTMQILANSKDGIVTYQELLDNVFHSSDPLESLISHLMLTYRPVHCASVTSADDSVRVPTVSVTSPVILYGMKKIINNPPKPLIVLRVTEKGSQMFKNVNLIDTSLKHLQDTICCSFNRLPHEVISIVLLPNTELTVDNDLNQLKLFDCLEVTFASINLFDGNLMVLNG